MAIEPIDAIILAGGSGSRIAPVLGETPKVLAPIHAQPFLKYLLRYLTDSAVVRKVVIAAGYQADQIVEHCDQTAMPLPVAFSIETSPLGTGGALMNALPDTTGETVMVVNGDSYVDLDLADMSAFHSANSADATLAAVQVDDARASGTLALDKNRITAFAEKSSDTAPGWINAGLYIFERARLEKFSSGPSSLERDIMPQLIEGHVQAYKTETPFIDIGTPGNYATAEGFFRAF
jgi:NDP-sugar pyrophosphorylase family protein